MADNDTAASSPSSTAAASGPKAPKDRSCPFCGQSFTSSSLGRHLDLYIKPKNPKPADGIHDVEEIRKIRGGITRRQPRSSHKASSEGVSGHGAARAQSNDPMAEATGKSIQTENRSIDRSPVISPAPANEVRQPPRVGWNTANWQATGVINNLPPRSALPRDEDTPPSGQAQRMQEMRRDRTGQRIQRPEYENGGMSRLEEAAEVGRAAEMALREVLGSLEAAQKELEPQQLFPEVDFKSLSFPGLCLAILPAPPTILSPTPFPSPDSWSLSPPGQKQYDSLNKSLHDRVNGMKKTGGVADSFVFMYYAHLSGAWEHWESLSESERASAWNLEILRSLHQTQKQTQQLRSELEISQQRARHLEAEYDRLSRCQLPREYLSHPPNTVPVAPALMRQIKPRQFNSGVGEIDYDADALLTKWRTTIRSTVRQTRAPRATHQPTTAFYDDDYYKSDLRDDILMNGSIWKVGGEGPMPRNVANPHVSDQPVVSYETPPQPGLVTSAEDIEDEDGIDAANARAAGDADRDAEGHATDDLDIDVNPGAMTRHIRADLHNFRDSSTPEHGVNANGKRSLGPAMDYSRKTKVYKAQTANAPD